MCIDLIRQMEEKKMEKNMEIIIIIIIIYFIIIESIRYLFFELKLTKYNGKHV